MARTAIRHGTPPGVFGGAACDTRAAMKRSPASRLVRAAIAIATAFALGAPGCASPRPFDLHRVPASAPLEDGPVEVPVTTSRGVVLVPVLVDGRGPLWFVLDTGSTTVVLDRSLAEDLDIRIEERAGSIVTEAGRSDGTVRQATLRELRIGTAKYRLVSALAMDMASISRGVGRTVDGILGMPVFQGRLWSVDPTNSTVRIEEGALAPDAPDTLALSLDGGLPTVRIEVAGREMDAIVDTGQRMAVSVGPEDAKPLRAGLRVIGESVGQVLDGEVRRDVARLDGDVRIGTLVTLRAPPILLGRATRVGMEAFPDRVLTFDFANRLMRASRAGDR